MVLKTLNDVDVTGKTILYRAPYDIAVDKVDGELTVTDNSRIAATIPTLKYLIEKGCKIVVLTWVKRPEGVEEDLRTIPHAKELSKLLNQPVKQVTDCIGPKVQEAVKTMNNGDVLMLENVRFYTEEYIDDDAFATELTNGYDLIVFDAFPQAHRSHASTTGILRHLPAVVGYYFELEYKSLDGILKRMDHPFTLIIGGAKLSDKIDAVKNLMTMADIVLLGGSTTNIFLRALGRKIGGSHVEEVSIEDHPNLDLNAVARDILSRDDQVTIFNSSENLPIRKVFIPHDFVVGKSKDDDSNPEVVLNNDAMDIPADKGIYDIGPTTAKMYSEIISQSKTVFWAGPMGVFEKQNYANGTLQVIKALNSNPNKTIVAGGDAITSLNKFGDATKVTHISLAGGATLDFLGGKPLVVLQYLTL